jgi:hypothetical protein
MIETTRTALWQAIVAATEDLGPVATSLRIPLWDEFRQRPRAFRKKVRAIGYICGQFLKAPRKGAKRLPKGRVLFCLPHRTPSNLNNFLPVAREALRRGMLGGILTGPDLSSELREFVGVVPVVSGEEIAREFGVVDRLRLAVQVAKSYKQITSALARHLTGFRLSGRRTMLVQMLVGSVLSGELCKRLLDEWSPDSVISTSDFWPLEHQLCRQASARGIPSLIIQHGTIDYIWWPFVADFYLMWGQAHVDQMLNIGAPADRLKVLGMPATDKLFARTGVEQHVEVKKDALPVCLLLSMTNGISAEPEIFRSYREFLAEALKLIPFVTWKVKFHPVENDSFYREMGDALYERLVFHPKSMSLEDAVNDADIVTTVYSTAGMEAMVMDRPLIVAPYSPRIQELAWWPAMGGGKYARSAEEFQEQLRKLISDPSYRARQLAEQREFLSKSFANQGHAAERIVDLLEQYTGQRRPSQSQSQSSVGSVEDLAVRSVH